MAKKKLLTLEQLVKFCQENNFQNFSSDDAGYTLSVQVPCSMSFSEESDDSLMYVKVKACHTGLNRNQSYISESNMKKAMSTLKYKPVLASIVETDDGFDFNGHDMEFIEDEDGNLSINYIEKQVGSFTADDPTLEYDSEADKTYVMATAVIPREYTKAAEIIEKKNGTKVSVELAIDKMSYNAKEKYLELEDFIFSGMTLLGESVKEGMAGSRLDIADFSTKVNSVQFEQDDKYKEITQKLDLILNNLVSNSKEGGKNMFEELLKKYGKTEEDIDFDYSEMSDEDLEAKFEELFGSMADPADEGETDDSEDFSEEPEAGSEEESFESEEEIKEEGFSIKYAVTAGDYQENFSVSLSEKLSALTILVNDTYAETDCCYYSVDVYEDEKTVLMVDCWTGRAFKQGYKVKKDQYSLTGDRVEVFAVYVTEDERKELDHMRSNYSSICEKLEKYEAEPSKVEILSSEDYALVRESEEFSNLCKQENHFDLTVDEVREQADNIILAYAKAGKIEFSAKTDTVIVGKKSLPQNPKKIGKFGNLHSKNK